MVLLPLLAPFSVRVSVLPPEAEPVTLVIVMTPTALALLFGLMVLLPVEVPVSVTAPKASVAVPLVTLGPGLIVRSVPFELAVLNESFPRLRLPSVWVMPAVAALTSGSMTVVEGSAVVLLGRMTLFGVIPAGDWRSTVPA